MTQVERSYLYPLIKDYLFPGEGMTQPFIGFVCPVYEYELEVSEVFSTTHRFEPFETGNFFMDILKQRINPLILRQGRRVYYSPALETLQVWGHRRTSDTDNIVLEIARTGEELASLLGRVVSLKVNQEMKGADGKVNFKNVNVSWYPDYKGAVETKGERGRPIILGNFTWGESTP